jgi:hypothetical protein
MENSQLVKLQCSIFSRLLKYFWAVVPKKVVEYYS